MGNNLELALSSEHMLDFSDKILELSKPAEILTQCLEFYVKRYEGTKKSEEALRVKEYRIELARRENY